MRYVFWSWEGETGEETTFEDVLWEPDTPFHADPLSWKCENNDDAETPVALPGVEGGCRAIRAERAPDGEMTAGEVKWR